MLLGLVRCPLRTALKHCEDMQIRSAPFLDGDLMEQSLGLFCWNWKNFPSHSHMYIHDYIYTAYCPYLRFSYFGMYMYRYIYNIRIHHISLTIYYIYIISLLLEFLELCAPKIGWQTMFHLKAMSFLKGSSQFVNQGITIFHTSVDPWDLRAPGVIRDRILLSFKNGRRNKQLISSSWQLAYFFFFFPGKLGPKKKPTITNDLLAQIGSVHSRGFGPFSSKSSAKHARCEKSFVALVKPVG